MSRASAVCAVICYGLLVLVGLATSIVFTGWGASLVRIVQIRDSVLTPEGQAAAGRQSTSTEAYMEALDATTTSSTSRNPFFWMVIAWQFGPYGFAIGWAIVVFVMLKRLTLLGKATCSTIALWGLCTLIVTTVAYFRMEASLRLVAITRFPGDGGFRELKATTVIPAVGPADWESGNDVTLGTPSDRLSPSAQALNVPPVPVFKAVLRTSNINRDGLGLWIAPKDTYHITKQPTTGRAMGVLLTGAEDVDSAGVVQSVGTSATIVGFATWAFGVEQESAASDVFPRPCGTDPDTPPADALRNLVCGVSGWVSGQSVALGQTEVQLSTFARMQGAVRQAHEALLAAAPGTPNATATALASIITQVPNLRTVLNTNRANIAFANDAYVAFTLYWMLVWCLLVLYLLCTAVYDPSRRSNRFWILEAFGIMKPEDSGSTLSPLSSDGVCSPNALSELGSNSKDEESGVADGDEAKGKSMPQSATPAPATTPSVALASVSAGSGGGSSDDIML